MGSFFPRKLKLRSGREWHISLMYTLQPERPGEYSQNQEHKEDDYYDPDDCSADTPYAELNPSEKSHPIRAEMGGWILILSRVVKTSLSSCENMIRTCSIGTTVDENQIKGILKKLGIRASKRLGQHFLVDEDIASRQVSLAGPLDEDIVLEVGPGLGVLTTHLLERSREVVAVEKDKRLCSFLHERFPNLNLIEGDALKVELPAFDKVVSNLPYEISSPITFRLLDFGFRKGVLMYQREFADRLVSKQGQKGYSKLSVVVSYRASARILETVPKEKFFPIPKVDSAIVELVPREAPFHVESEKHFLNLVDVLFRHRRKKIGNSILLSWESFFRTENEARSYVREAKWSDRRVEELTPAQIAGISNEIATKD